MAPVRAGRAAQAFRVVAPLHADAVLAAARVDGAIFARHPDHVAVPA